MYLQALRTDALRRLKNDIKTNIRKYCMEDGVWVNEYFKEKEIKIPFYSTEINFPSDFELTGGNGSTDDTENAIRFHSALRGKITPAQAADYRLWGALTHTQFYHYMRSRWKVKGKNDNQKSDKVILNRYFWGRGLLRNGISRLYWLAEITYDEKLEDPYMYTRYLMHSQDLINQVDGSSLCRNRAFLRALLKVLKREKNLSEQQIRRYFERMNQKGGVILLDALSDDHMEEICSRILEKVLSEKRIQSNSRLVLQPLEGRGKIVIKVKKGHAYVGKTKIKTKPDNLLRLSLGKNLSLGKKRYIITDILTDNL